VSGCVIVVASKWLHGLVTGCCVKPRHIVRERGQSRSPQRHENLHSSANNDVPSTGRWGPVRSHGVQRHGAAPGPSNASSQQFPAPRTSQKRMPLSAGECPAGPAAGVCKGIGTAVMQAQHSA